MEKFYVMRNEEMQPEFNAEGFASVELLPGTHDGSVVNYKCFLKAGCQVSPERFGDRAVLLMFGKGTGYVTDANRAYEIRELSFYFPDFDKMPYAIHAVTDMEFVMAVVQMSEADWQDYADTHLRLPFFRSLSECVKYDQDCKGPNTTSWHVLCSKHLGHVIMGVVRATGEGTIEKGHPSVHQWNYCVGDSDFDLTVDGVTVPHRAGEWSFIPAGPDHSLVAKPGKEVFYVWFEQFTRKDRDFIYQPAPRKALPEAGKEKFYLVRDEELRKSFDENGFAMCELLPGTYDGGIRNYKCFLKAGCEVAPRLSRDDTVLLMFGKGKGYITSAHAAHNITEPAFYAPDFDKEPYTVHAVEDMEFVFSEVRLNEDDRKKIDEGHIRLPFFRLYSEGTVYDQDCKGPNTTSWLILGPEQLGRIMAGVVRAKGEGTREKGHPSVEQWNYCLGNANFKLQVDSEPEVAHKAGEWSYIPAGRDHALVADPGEEVFYVWYEHFTREKDFRVALAKDEDMGKYR